MSIDHSDAVGWPARKTRVRKTKIRPEDTGARHQMQKGGVAAARERNRKANQRESS